MLYKRTTLMCNDDWGYFIDIDDTPINKINKGSFNSESHNTTTSTFQWLNETYITSLEIPRKNIINTNCICSIFVTTFTLGSIVCCFVI